jgi:cytochrome c biogenesis protein CcmG, thiol:disulfide interchange protein DsbE
MTSKKSIIFIWILAIISALFGLFLFGLFNRPSNGRDLPLDSSKTKTVIPFELETLPSPFNQYGSTISSSSFTGKPLVINFWASWCEPCHEEAPALEATWQHYKTEVQFVGINTLDRNSTAATQFVLDYRLTFPIGMDTDNKVGIDYAIFSVPETFFFKKDGTLSHRQIGPITSQELDKRLKAISQE